MTSILHALNTGTLAAWLSVAGFGTVGILVPEWHWSPSPKPAEEVVTQVFDPEILLGDGNLADKTPADPSSLAAIPAVTPESLPEPPEMPDLTEQEPLPEIPKLPEPAPEKENPVVKPAEDIPAKPAETPRKQATSRPRPVNSATRGTPTLATGGPPGAGTGMSDSARLAAGRMPAPSYPLASRRAGQAGTVTVAFTVDSSGRVISAYATNPSPWPLLNEEAVRTVRGWKFPPGGVMKLQRPIVFQLR
ncbi:MAG: TonB family protein [Verrucomicrobiota bacterium]